MVAKLFIQVKIVRCSVTTALPICHILTTSTLCHPATVIFDGWLFALMVGQEMEKKDNKPGADNGLVRVMKMPWCKKVAFK